MSDNRNITLDLIEYAQSTPDETALIVSDREISYRELNQLTWQCAQYLHDQGVGSGMVVAVTCANEITLALVILGLIRLGATTHSVPRSSTPLQREEMAARVEASVLISDHPERFGAGIPSIAVDYDVLTEVPCEIRKDIMPEIPDAPWLLITGSGTTGEPKLLPVTHAQQRARHKMEVASLRIVTADRWFELSHLDFSNAKHRLLTMLSAGAAFGLIESNLVSPIRLCQQRKFTLLGATPFHVESMLANLSDDTSMRLSAIRGLALSTATVSAGLRERIRRLLCSNLYVSYGSNETGRLTLAGPPEVYTYSGTVGIPLSGVELEIVDRETLEPLPVEDIGLIRVRSSGLINGYLGNEKATKEFFREGWFFPGDLGKLTDGGQLIHYGRADQMMIKDGINIYPAEIENVMLSHPAVREAAAVPLRHETHQDVPVCAVTLHSGTGVSEQELLTFARGRLGIRGPGAVAVVEEIPRNELGKIVRGELTKYMADRFKFAAPKTPALVNAPATNGSPSAMDLGGTATPDVPPWLARQPLRFMGLAMKYPGNVDLERLDRDLSAVFNLEIEACKAPDRVLKSADQAVIAGIAWRGMLLGRELFQAAGLPAFDAGYIAAVERGGDDNAWRVRIGVPHIHHIDKGCYQIAYAETAKIVANMLRSPVHADRVEPLREMVSRRLIATLRNRGMSGKSTIHVLGAAHELGVPFLHIGGGVYQLGWGSRSRQVNRSTTDGDAASGSRLAQNKVWTADVLRMSGLPVPVHGLAGSVKEAGQLAGKLGWPVVVKPVDGDRGEGVSVGIRSEEELAHAYGRAKKASRSGKVIVEREANGICHRLFVASGRLLYAVKRLPKSVAGDGVHSVAELIAIANEEESAKPSWLRTEPFPGDELAVMAMRAAGFTMDSVPQSGELVPLRAIESTADGGVDEDVSHCIHPHNLDAALRATQLCNLEVAGVDIITPDISRSWTENGAIINELNYSPLLGGAAISKSHVPEFVRRVMGGGDGRVPVEVYVGGNEAFASARARQREILADGRHCYLTSHSLTLDSRGEEIPVPLQGLYRRGLALLLNRQVEHIILVVQTDELLRTGFPVDRIDRLTSGPDEPLEANAEGTPLSPDRAGRLVTYLKNLRI
ncbi:MAG: AMP-binding protein [Porticoccaceae bacterium]